MKKKISAIAIILVVLVLVGISAQGDYSQAFQDWKGLSLAQLEKKSKKCLEQGNIDSALICYTMIMNKYDSDMDIGLKDICCNAFNNAGYLFFYNRNDYSSSYSCLLKALDIAEESGISDILPYIYLNMGNIYINYNDTHASDSLYRKAFYASVSAHSDEIMITTLSNLAISAMSRNKVESVQGEIAVFRRQRLTQKEMVGYITDVCKAADRLGSGDTLGAIHFLKEAKQKVDTKLTPERYTAGCDMLIATLFSRIGKQKQAIDVLRRVEASTDGVALDLQSETCGMMSDVYRKLNMSDSAMAYHSRQLTLSDSLFRKQQYGLIRDMKGTYEIRKLDEQVRLMDQKRRNAITVLVLSTTVGIIFMLLSFAIYRKNKKLRRSNRELYLRNEEMLNFGNNERRQRAVYEKKLEEYEAQLVSLQKSIDKEKDAVDNTPAKYASSTLDDYAKQKLLTKIGQVLESVETISNTEFSVDMLSKMVGSNSRYVSQVINETYGKNFNALLGETRVKQACLRLRDDATYGNMTIEAIALDLGFKSRSNFVTVFKKVTGLSPSEYKKIGKEVGQ